MKNEKEKIQLNGIRCPKDIVDFIDELVAQNVFSSRSHGVVRILRIGMEAEKHRAKVVHEWEGIGLKDGTTRVKVQGPPQKREPEE